jgi:TctA family transporter
VIVLIFAVGKLFSLFFSVFPSLPLVLLLSLYCVQLSIFWLVIIALVIFRMEWREEIDSKEVKGKGKNMEKNKTKKQTKKVSKI